MHASIRLSVRALRLLGEVLEESHVLVWHGLRLPVAGRGGAELAVSAGPGTMPGSAHSPSPGQLGALTGFNPSNPSARHTLRALFLFLPKKRPFLLFLLL